MLRKFKTVFLLTSSIFVLAAHADPIKSDFFQVQVLKNGIPFVSQAPILTTEGNWGAVEQYQRRDQINMECNGDALKLMQSIERGRGAAVVARRDADVIKATVTIKDVEPQILPENGHFQTCVSITAHEQITKKVDVDFLVTDPAKADFTKDLGDGFSLVLKVARLIH